MKKLRVLAVALALLIAPFAVLSQDVQLTAGQTIEITLTSPSVTYTISSTTGINSFTVSNSTATFTLDAGDNLTVKQANGYVIQNDLNVETQCDGSATTITFTQTVVLTSSTTARSCVAGGGGSTTPSSDSITINNGATQTTVRTVTLNLFANGASEMMISTSAAFTGAQWEPYARTKSWTLTEGNGEKRVYIKYRSAQGAATVPISAIITLAATEGAQPPTTPPPTEPSPQQLSEGSLVKARSSATVYVYEGGTLRPILNADVFAGKKYQWSDIRLFDSIGTFTIGSVVDYSDLPIADGMLVKASDSKVYLIYNNRKWWIQDGETFEGLGYQWRNVRVISDAKLAIYADGTAIINSITRHPDGTLIKYANSPKVYLLDQGKKRWITTEQDFRDRNYQFRDVVILPLAESYPDGDPIGVAVRGFTTAEPLFRSYLAPGSVGDEVRLLQLTLQRLGFLSASERVTGYYGTKTRQAVLAFQKHHRLEQLGVVGPGTRDKLNEEVEKLLTPQQ